jgi:BON domain
MRSVAQPRDRIAGRDHYTRRIEREGSSMRRFYLGLATCAVAMAWPASASADNKEFSQGVAAALRDSGRLVDYSIGVTTKGTVVTLEGRVANKDQMIEAIQMTSGMSGVSKVVNHLEIKPSAHKPRASATQKAEVAAAKLAEEAQTAVEDGMTSVRKTIFPDPSLPAESQSKRNDQVSNRRAKPSASVAKKPTPATSKAYAVRQTSQSAPGTFIPSENAQTIAEPQLNDPQMAMQAMPTPNMPGPQMSAQRLAMAPLAMAGGAAGLAMGQCPPGGGPGGMGGGPPGGAMMGGPMMAGGNGPLPMAVPAASGGVAPARYDQPYMPNYAWPSYAAYPNYAAVSYPRQYSPTAWPYIGPFYPYPQVPLGWRKVMLEWDDGWWMLNFKQ